jgi:hypothetical protein
MIEAAVKKSQEGATVILRACCPNRKDAFGEMLRQAQHDNSLAGTIQQDRP